MPNYGASDQPFVLLQDSLFGFMRYGSSTMHEPATCAVLFKHACTAHGDGMPLMQHWMVWDLVPCAPAADRRNKIDPSMQSSFTCVDLHFVVEGDIGGAGVVGGRKQVLSALAPVAGPAIISLAQQAPAGLQRRVCWCAHTPGTTAVVLAVAAQAQCCSEQWRCSRC